MMAIAAGEVDATWTAAWLKDRKRFVEGRLVRLDRPTLSVRTMALTRQRSRGLPPNEAHGGWDFRGTPDVLEPPAF